MLLKLHVHHTQTYRFLSRGKRKATVKKIGNHYYLYHATSKWNPEKHYPESVQTYIGKITKDGVLNERVSIAVNETEACLLSELIEGLPDDLGNLIVLKIKGRKRKNMDGLKRGNTVYLQDRKK